MANNLKLPDISEGTISAPSAAGAFDRAGAAVGQAGEKVAGVFAEAQQAQTVVESQEAALQHTRGLNESLRTIRDNPYVSPDWVKNAFGGNVPSGISLTEQVAVPGSDKLVEQDRAVIPMHKVAPYLFDQQAKIALDNASGQIEARGFADKFRQAAAADEERARTEMFTWQRAQMMADAQIQTTAQLQQAAASRNWNLYETILNTPQNMLDVKERESFRAELPRLKTKASIEDRLRSRSTEELQKLLSDVAANVVDGDKNGFHAALSAEEQLHFTTAAHARLREIEHEEDRAEKRASEQRFENEGDKIQMAVNRAQQTGRPVSDYYSVSDIPVSLKLHEFENVRNLLASLAKPPGERKTDNNTWMALSDLDRQDKLPGLSKAQMMSYWPGLSEADQRHWMDRWAKAQEPGAGPKKPLFTEPENAAIDHVLTGFYKIDPKKDPDLFNSTKAQLQRNLLTWRQKNPDEPMLYDTIRTEGRLTTFTADASGSVFGLFGTNSEKSWLKAKLNDGDAVGAWQTLNIGLRAAHPGQTVSDQDVLEHVKQMELERPTVAAAWQAINSATPLDGTARAAVHSVLINPVELRRVDGELAAEKQPVSDRNRIWRIVQDMQLPQSRPAADAAAAKARQEAEGRDTRKAGEELAAKIATETAAGKAVSAAAVKAERDRFQQLPYWQQHAELDTRAAWEAQETGVEQQVHARVYAEDYAAQQAAKAAGKAKYTVGDRLPNDPVRIEMDKRVAAEVASGRPARKEAFDARQREAQGAYRQYWQSQMVDEDGSVKTFAPAGFMDYSAWLQSTRRGGRF